MKTFKTVPLVVTLCCYLLLFACKKSEVDPCSQASATDCSGLTTTPFTASRPIESQNYIHHVTVNPNNPDEIAFVGVPEGYEDERLFVGSVSERAFHPIAVGYTHFRNIPEWGKELILYPFRNNAIWPDGTYFGPIPGCPDHISLYPKWCDDGKKIAVNAFNIAGDPAIMIYDMKDKTLENYGPFSDEFAITNDASKVVSTEFESAIRWMDLSTQAQHRLDFPESTASAMDWLRDNRTIVWIRSKKVTNACGITFGQSSLNLTDVTTNTTRCLAESCTWDEYVHAKASPDGQWIYVLKRHVELDTNGGSSARTSLWRIKVDGSQEEFVVR